MKKNEPKKSIFEKLFQNFKKKQEVHLTDKEKVRPVSMENGGSYVERTNLLLMMEEKLKGDSSEKHILILSGHGGEGKSELARAYAYKHKEEFEEIFLVSVPEEMNKSGKVDKLSDLLSKAGYDLLKPDEKDSDHKSEYDLLPDNTLFIIDNYNTEDVNFMNEIINKTSKCDFIITSRLHSHRKLSDSYFLHVDEVSDNKLEFCKSLFIKTYELPNEDGETVKVSEKDLDDIETIVEGTSFNPMLTVLSAAELREYKKRSIREFAVRIQRGLNAAHLNGAEVNIIRNEGEELTGELPQIVFNLFSDIFTYEFSNEELEVLTLLSLNPSIPIDEDYLCILLGDDEDNIRISEVLKRMSKSNWIQRQKESVSIHPLTSKLLQNAELSEKIQLFGTHDFFTHLVKNWISLPFDFRGNDKIWVDIIFSAFCKEEKREKLDISEKSLLIPYYTYLIRNRYISAWQIADYYDPRVDEEEKKNLKTLNEYFGNQKKVFDLISELVSDVKEGFLIEKDFTYGTQYWIYYLKESTNKKLQKHCLLGSSNYRLSHKYFGEDTSIDQSFVKNEEENQILSSVFSKDRISEKLFSYLETLDISEITDRAFMFCDSVEAEIHLPKNLKKIGEDAFNHCNKLKGTLTFPDSVTEIERKAFYECASLESLTLPLNLTEIRDRVFSGCVNLHGNLVIPDGVKLIGKGAFESCGFTGDLIIPDSVEELGSYAFDGCKYFDGKLHLSENLTEIPSAAFSWCDGFVGRLQIPEKVTTIGRDAFFKCSGFTGDLWIPDHVKIIKGGAFDTCRGFSSVRFSKELTEISSHAFNNCGFTGKLQIPDCVRTIGSGAFMGCKGLTSLVLPEKLEEIGTMAFIGLGELSGNLILPSGIKKIGEQAFQNCKNLSGDLILPDSLIELGLNAFSRCTGFSGNLRLSKKLKKIEKGTFYNCENFTGELIIPDSVEYIGGDSSDEVDASDRTFFDHIGNGAFENCKNLTRLSMSNNIKKIEGKAFKGCENLSGSVSVSRENVIIKDTSFDGSIVNIIWK